MKAFKPAWLSYSSRRPPAAGSLLRAYARSLPRPQRWPSQRVRLRQWSALPPCGPSWQVSWSTRSRSGNPGDFDSLNSTREIADKVLERLIEQFIPIDEADRQGLVDLYERHLKETEEYLASIRARPIIAERVDSRNLKTPWRDHRPFTPASPLRIGYKGNGTKPA
jgi:hypothetical protein